MQWPLATAGVVRTVVESQQQDRSNTQPQWRSAVAPRDIPSSAEEGSFPLIVECLRQELT
jgi:hypothetical protein